MDLIKINGTFDEKNPVDVASSTGFLSIVKLLLDKGLKGSDESIFEAFTWGYSDIIKILIHHQDDLLKVKDYKGDTPLCLASINGDFDLVKLFLSKGVGVNEQNLYGETALTHTCNFLSYPSEKMYDVKCYLSIASLLLEHQANVHLKTYEGFTASMIAARFC
eukprot:CAMPEP_0117427606 /NCGR_PEP_ID=MMETSP0758-20121206/7438_1 /TAXON_ID=63605 /ORGANISM="Percolomonas cosmopolitus, Strain AE-1 (ATCC 50343)" /LENGTH=162 /DNA_ID=CAMNT_0005213379 /DNA_START=892 /DNA_END=1377 /DNA_ORIENTATION=+